MWGRMLPSRSLRGQGASDRGPGKSQSVHTFLVLSKSSQQIFSPFPLLLHSGPPTSLKTTIPQAGPGPCHQALLECPFARLGPFTCDLALDSFPYHVSLENLISFEVTFQLCFWTSNQWKAAREM